MLLPGYNSILPNGRVNFAVNISSFTENPPEICFGMLCDISIQWISAASRQKSNHYRDVSDAKLVLSNESGDIVDTFGNTIATLNKKTYSALSSVAASISPVRFDLIQETIDQKGPSTSSSINRSYVGLLVLGPRSVGNDLAKELSRYHMFLQHPVTLPSNFSYENPQYLNIAGASFSNGSLLPAITGYDEIESNSDVPPLQEDEQQVDTISYVLDHLPEHTYLKEAEIDPRISTTLLHHQKEGVDFILRRENINGSNPRSLWKLSGLGQDRQIFRHKITDSTSDKPVEALGGILADAMGVGKTLTMIASIASNLKGRISDAQTHEPEESSKMSRVPVNSTLILVPSALLLDGWIAEIEKHVASGTLRYYKYHGPNRRLPLSSNLPFDIIISTYGTITADLRHGGSVLYSLKWYRLVLDEAHVIRNWPTKQFKAVMQLDAGIRWCMTGTPIQNSLEDLASLVKFLRVPILEDISTFRRYIIGRKKTASGLIKPNFEKLRLLLGSICLRRSTSVLSQLGVTFMTCKPKFSTKEREMYDGLATVCQKSIEETVSCDNTQKISQRPILEALLRMRIFCNLGLSINNTAALNQPYERSNISQQDNGAICVFCSSYIDDISKISRQNHNPLCIECIPQHTQEARGEFLTHSDSRDSNDGARHSTELDSSRTTEVGRGESTNWECPSKLRVLLENIKKQNLQDKSIVFSSWIKSLDAVAKLLTEHRITFRRVDGSLPVSQRKQMLSEFQDPSVRVLLMTLGTGAVGLNQLSIASQLHLLEPQWNPSVESQAIGRVIRLDQKKQVTIIRYVTTSTIEESIENRQALKLRLSIAGGLQSSSSDHTERIQGLRELAETIQSQLKS
ncbi:SNF2 family N-terminal domain-containing protein [Annulohypoxylon moriforme]|nr:SNF2 family N-terminal domain-containing protein [Annulohypoxylon moriforme]